jgi:simple sugar transport system permease protein
MRRLLSGLRLLGKIEALPILFVLILVYVVFSMTAPDVFGRWRIYMSIAETGAPLLILGLGLTFIITSGEIDLSFPAIVAFSGFIFSWCFINLDDTFGKQGAAWVGLFAAIAGGAGVGYTNGLLVARVGVPSIMATLAAQFFWSGVTVLLVSGLQLNVRGIDDTLVHQIFARDIHGIIPDPARGRIAIPSQALWATALTIFLWFILNRHKFGEAAMFIGDNANVARVMGINVDRTRIQLFTLMGAISAFAGVILTLEARVFFPTQGQGMLLPVMAAVFIGGTSIAGGYGLVVGTFFGTFIVRSLEAGVVASGVSGFWTQLVTGAVMAASVILHTLLNEGHLGMLSERVRHWSAPSRVRTGSEMAPPQAGD